MSKAIFAFNRSKGAACCIAVFAVMLAGIALPLMALAAPVPKKVTEAASAPRIVAQAVPIPKLVAPATSAPKLVAQAAPTPEPTAADRPSADQIPPLRGPLGASASNQLDNIIKQADDSEGAMFVGPDKVMVKAPLLTALVQLNRNLSPYGIDALGNGRPVSLRDVLTWELSNNLDIQISHSDEQAKRWNYRSTLGGFLPTMTNMVTFQGITGRYASPFGALTNVGSPYLTIPSALNWNVFDGGRTIFGSRQAKHLYNAASFEKQQTTNDILLDGTHLYYQLVLQEVILQIRIKAVETSQALLQKNKVQYKYGANTKLDVLQAETQLANDTQALISQQIARRKAAIKLATSLNLDSGDDLIINEGLIEPKHLVDTNAKVNDLVQIAIDNRPELKKYEQQRLAAKEAIRVAYSPLLPQLIGSAGVATTGATVAPLKGAANASSASTGSFGAGGFSTGTVASVGSSNAPREFNLAEIYLIGVTAQWNIGGLGLTDFSNVQAAKWLSRKAQLEFSRQLSWVCKSVRDAYVDSVDNENLIVASSAAVNSSRQQLRVAANRLEEGVGTDLDVVNAQRDYTNALISKANAIVQYNESQAQLLRAMGRISVGTLTSRIPLAR